LFSLNLISTRIDCICPTALRSTCFRLIAFIRGSVDRISITVVFVLARHTKTLAQVLKSASCISREPIGGLERRGLQVGAGLELPIGGSLQALSGAGLERARRRSGLEAIGQLGPSSDALAHVFGRSEADEGREPRLEHRADHEMLVLDRATEQLGLLAPK